MSFEVLERDSKCLEGWSYINERCYETLLENQIVSNIAVKVRRNSNVRKYTEWGPTFSISMDVEINSWGSGWSSLFRVSQTSGDCCSNGLRYPAVFINGDGYLHITTSLNNNGNMHWNLNSIPLKKSFNLAILQTKEGNEYFFNVHINGESKVREKNNNILSKGNAKFYIGDKYYQPADALVKNVYTNGVVKKGCPDGWAIYESDCYLFFDSYGVSWNDARSQCNIAGGELASIQNSAEHNFLNLFTNGARTW